ncbi:MAG: DNA translocase FtsK [Planctomycetaceae bacterium]|jgi:S-DNA-T family DNA segregation ATPase FtsK/SpoIIIE|nr:DNA translocase FtsK [Planctomycetaceae bacterium]
MKPLGLRFLGVVVSTLFVVFTISVLSYSPDDFPIASVLTTQNVNATANPTNNPEISNNPENQPNPNNQRNTEIKPSQSSNVNSNGIGNIIAPPNPAIANNAANNHSIITQNFFPEHNNNDDDDEKSNPNYSTPSIDSQPKQIKNLCGPIGAILSSISIYFFGQSTLILLLPFGAFAVKLLVNPKFDQLFLRTIGFVFMLVGFCGLCGLFANKLIGFPLATEIPGGLIGSLVATTLDRNVAVVGSVVLLFSLIVGGSILFADNILLQLAILLIALLKNSSANQSTGNPPPSSPSPQSPNHDSSKITNRQTDQSTSSAQSIIAYNIIPDRDNSRPIVRHHDPNSVTIKNNPNANSKQIITPNNFRTINEITTNNKIPTTKNISRDYKLPSVELLTKPEIYNDNDLLEESEHQAIQIEEVFKTFNLQVEVVDVQTGPTVSQFELQLAKGLRINKIQQLADDLGLALRVPKVRIVNPIPGKNTLGVELPNKNRRIVRMRELIEESPESWQSLGIPFFLGKDVSGKPMISDLATLTHLLIAGRTGTGKSVCLNSIIVSILMTRTPNEVRMIMIDPKSVELSPYQKIPHLIHPVVIDMSKTEAVLSWVVDKMEERYRLLNAARVVHINDYNKLSEVELRQRMELVDCSDEEWQIAPKKMPRLVIIIDEFGDLMSSVTTKGVEDHIVRLAQKSRAVGIHLVLATQKPTVDVITGRIKSNLPARISFGVATRNDSMVILDQTGAERLLGLGDLLFLNSDKNEIVRGQGTFVDRDDIDEIVNEIKTDTPDFIDELTEIDGNNSDSSNNYNVGGGIANRTKRKDDNAYAEDDQRDELYEKAVEYVIGEGRGSTSLLQRKLSIGYGRAAKIIEMMAAEGIVGPYNGSQAREVIMTLNDWYRLSAKRGNQSGNQTGARAFLSNDNDRNNYAGQRTTSKVLSDVLAGERIKTSPKNGNGNGRQTDINAGSIKNSNIIRPAIPVSSDLNVASDYRNNNDYFDPTYDNNENNKENYDDGFEFAS